MSIPFFTIGLSGNWYLYHRRDKRYRRIGDYNKSLLHKGRKPRPQRPRTSLLT